MAATHSVELAAPRPAGWLDRLLAWRDRLVASPAFQRRAAGNLLTRGVAKRRAAGLFDLVAGFVYSQVLLACVQLRLFDLLADRPMTPEAIAARLELPLEAAQRLLGAAVALRLLERRSRGRYGLGELGAPMVGNTAIASMVLHHAALYADLADPVALLRRTADTGRGTALARYWPYADSPLPGALPAHRVAEYSALMSASQPLVADEILDAYSLRGHHCLLDVGGGDGTFLARVAQRHAGLKLMLFDLPAVAEHARMRFANAALMQRASAFGGDFVHDDLPPGADIASLVRVIHDHDDARALAILRNVRRALPPHGTLLLAEPMAGTPGAEAMGDAYFGFYLLAMGRGRARSATELTALLESAGFAQVRLLTTRLPLQTQLLVARCDGVNPSAK